MKLEGITVSALQAALAPTLSRKDVLALKWPSLAGLRTLALILKSVSVMNR
jgi:hypothetical protein